MISQVELQMHEQEVADYPWNKDKHPNPPEGYYEVNRGGKWKEITQKEFDQLKKDPFTLSPKDKVQPILDSIRRELETATKTYGPFNSGHEGYAVLKEELEELWEAVKRNSKGAANREAIQIAAMAVRFILDNK